MSTTVANLTQHRRVRALLSELGDLARRHPRAGERLHQHLTDNRPQAPMESPVAKRSKQITLRIPEALFDDAQALTGPIEESPESMLYGQITPAFVMRLAMLEGMKVLKASYLGSQAPRLISTGRATGPSTFDIPMDPPAQRLSAEERTAPLFPSEPESPTRSTLAERMKAYRKRESIGQREAADRAKVSQSTWSKAEKGGNPCFDIVVKIETLLLGQS